MSTKFKVNLAGSNVELKDKKVVVKGKEGEMEAEIRYPFLKVEKKDDTLFIESEKDNKFQKAIAGTLAADIKNMIKGVNELYTAELELVYMHFPASLKLNGNKVVVENFVGERKPREIQIPKDLKVDVKGNKIIIFGIDKYKVGQLAGKIESKIQVKNKDRRVFKDGVFITKKP
jgi:large subunit ribosomal protein L6